MREDMSQVIVERPRIGGGYARRGRARALDELPDHEGMRRPYRLQGQWKQLNENLAPLRRYLAGQVGRPWDKVYSEIARNLSVASTVQQHVRDHLADFVAVHPQRIVYTLYPPGKPSRRVDRLWRQPFYVDPGDGLLKRTDRLPEARAERQARAKARTPRPPVRIPLGPGLELRRIKGLWFEVRMAPLPKPVFWEVRMPGTGEVVHKLVSRPVRDVATGKLVPVGPTRDDPYFWAKYRQRHPEGRYAVSKRALSRAELRRHELANDPGEG